MKLTFNIDKQKITCANTEKIVADSKNYLTAEFSFSEEWTGTKTAVFGHNGEYFNVLIEDNEVTVPWEVIKAPWFLVSVFGGNLMTTNIVQIPVEISGLKDGEEPSEPSKGAYTRILEIAQSVRDDADNGVFDGEQGIQGVKGDKGDIGEQGEQGEKGDKGDTGNDGYTPVRGVDYWTQADKTEVENDILSVSDNRYLSQDIISGVAPLKSKLGIESNSLAWSMTGENVGNLNATTNKYDIPIQSTGSNLCDINATMLKNINVTKIIDDTTMTLTINTDTAGYPIYYLTPIKLIVGKKYTVSADNITLYNANGTVNTDSYLTVNLDNVSTNQDSAAYGLLTRDVFSKTFTATSEYLYIHGYIGFANKKNYKVVIKGLRVNIGEADLQYEPYKSDTTTISLDNALSGTISNETQDIQLPVYEGATNYFVNTTVQPTDMSVKYYQNPTEVINELKNAIIAMGGNV